MKRLITLLSLLLVLAISAQAALNSVRITVATTPNLTGAQLTVDVLQANGSPFGTPITINKGAAVVTDAGGVLSFLLTEAAWTGITYDKDYLVRVTYGGVVLSIERMEVVYAKQGLYGALVEPSEIVPGTVGQVLTSTGTTNTWTAPANDWHLGGNAGTTPGTNYIGTSDGQALIFKVNDQPAGKIDYASPNTTSFGYQALMSASGTLNTAFGYQALTANTTGQANTAVGYNALSSNIVGGGNSAFGTFALGSNTGGENTAVGNSALSANTIGIYNTTTGYQSLASLTGANSYNTAYGHQAFLSLSSGNYNIAIGNGAGNSDGTAPLTSTNNSIYLGANTEASAASGNTNEIVIGYNATGNGSNSITLGNASITNTYLRGDVTATTFNGLTPTALATGFTIAGGTTTSKTLTVANTASVSGTNTGDIQEVTDQYSATASQVTFTLSQTPSTKCVVKLYINGVRISNAAISFTGTTATYDYTQNIDSSPLVASDRIQIDYFYIP
jgi:hypothetical protein